MLVNAGLEQEAAERLLRLIHSQSPERRQRSQEPSSGEPTDQTLRVPNDGDDGGF